MKCTAGFYYQFASLMLSLFLLNSAQAQAQAQSSFSLVYDILQTNCSGSSCHSGQSANPLKLINSDKSVVYNNIVGVDPVNETAKNKGDKIVDPGAPSNSFLLRKVAHELSQDLKLEANEGGDMPVGQASLSNTDVEIIRQWISFGAPETGNVVNEQLITRYYNGEGLPKVEPIAPPAPGEGIQIHEGPYFLDIGEEHEYLHKVDLRIPEDVEVYKIEMRMHSYSHHMILYKYQPGKAQNIEDGARLIGELFDQADVFLNANFIATWQYDRDVELPEGTGYFWDENTSIDANFHVPNYNDTAVLAAEFYINFYFRPRQAGTVEMFADLTPYSDGSGFPNGIYGLNVLNNATDTTFVINEYFQEINETRYFWVLQAHTHKLGKDYNIWLRNADGSKGEKVYNGFWNYDGNFNKGYYDWEHPEARAFSPLLPVDMSKGLIHEATYYNDGPAPVGFGLTTKDEMFITYYQYTKQLPTGILSKEKETATFNIYPNPYQNEFNLEYTIEERGKVVVELYDILGTQVSTLSDKTADLGTHIERFNTGKLNIQPGIYFIKLSVGEASGTKRIIQLK